MMKLSKRLTALLMALALMLTGAAALAEQAPVMPLTPQLVYDRGGAIETEVSLNVDAASVSGLVAMFGGGQQDEATSSIVDTVLSAVNKLKIKTVGNMANTFMTIGTDAGKLIDLQGVVNTELGDFAITTSLLPGIKLNLPQEMVKTMLSSQQQMSQQGAQMLALTATYGAAVTEYFTKNIAPAAQLVNEPVEVAGVGSFDNQVSFLLDNKTLAGMMNAVLDVFKQDSQTQQLLDDYLKTVATQQAALTNAEAAAATEGISMGSSDAPKDSKELIAQVDKAIANLNAEGDKKLANVAVLTSAASNATYVTMETLGSKGNAEAYITTLVTPTATGSDIKLELLAGVPSAQVSDGTATPDPAAEPAKVDWATLKAGVMDGSNYESTYVTADISHSADAASNVMNTGFDLSARMMGMVFGLNAKGSNSLAGEYASDAQIALSFMTPSPLVTINIKSAEAKEVPAAPVMDSLKAVTLSDKISDEDNQQLTEVLTKEGLPQLLENMKTALPEESALLIPMIQQSMSPAPTQAN